MVHWNLDQQLYLKAMNWLVKINNSFITGKKQIKSDWAAKMITDIAPWMRKLPAKVSQWEVLVRVCLYTFITYPFVLVFT